MVFVFMDDKNGEWASLRYRHPSSRQQDNDLAKSHFFFKV